MTHVRISDFNDLILCFYSSSSHQPWLPLRSSNSIHRPPTPSIHLSLSHILMNPEFSIFTSPDHSRDIHGSSTTNPPLLVSSLLSVYLFLLLLPLLQFPKKKPFFKPGLVSLLASPNPSTTQSSLPQNSKSSNSLDSVSKSQSSTTILLPLSLSSLSRSSTTFPSPEEAQTSSFSSSGPILLSSNPPSMLSDPTTPTTSPCLRFQIPSRAL